VLRFLGATVAAERDWSRFAVWGGVAAVAGSVAEVVRSQIAIRFPAASLSPVPCPPISAPSPPPMAEPCIAPCCTRGLHHADPGNPPNVHGCTVASTGLARRLRPPPAPAPGARWVPRAVLPPPGGLLPFWLFLLFGPGLGGRVVGADARLGGCGVAAGGAAVGGFCGARPGLRCSRGGPPFAWGALPPARGGAPAA